MNSIIRNILAFVAFLVVWVVFPSEWLLSLGVDATWVGLFKIGAAIAVAWSIVGRRRKSREPVNTQD